MIGQHILNYKIIQLIGEGGMGSVYLAEHTQFHRQVAIKALLPQYVKNEEIRLRFKNEAATMAHLQHPNIVSLHDYIEDETGLYLIMEYVQGKPLDEYIQEVTGPMPEDKAVPIMLQVLSAFEYAHKQKVVHRDIKPANILICDDGTAKVLDFGIARLLGENNQNLTRTGTQMGTVFYMSPEQVQGKKADHLSDIYSLGITFYQMLTGVNPYRGATTDYEVYNKIVKEDLPDPNSIYPGIPPYFKTILKKALEKNKEDRFQSCDEFSEAIRKKTVTSSVNKPITSNEYKVQLPQKRSNSQSIVSLVTGILAILISFFPLVNTLALILAIIAIVSGGKAMKNARMFKEFEGTAGGGKAGRILGAISIVIFLIINGFSLTMYFNKDSDGDGVPDRRDNCPWDYGKTDDGCPDMDGDGVLDFEDSCPDLAGSAAHNGCPDSDGDGVYDNEDNCPGEAGPKENDGCPWSDSDGDGIPDKDDNCPDEYGPSSNNGCPLQGECVFWFDKSKTMAWKGKISVYIDGEYEGEIEDWYSSNPGCYATGCVTISKRPGTYSWYATSDRGNSWNGEVTITSNNCIWYSMW